jgi:hypothetical protein
MAECLHEQVIAVHGKVNDTVQVQWPEGHWTDRYFGDVPGLIDGDYVHVRVCLDCQRVLDLASADDILSMDPGPPPPPTPRARVMDFVPECQVCGGEMSDCPACGGD